MKKLLHIFFLLLPFPLLSQGIKGTLSNAKGEVLPYVTIYSPSAKKGANSNIKGSFELKLSKGKHQIVFQSIDYKSQEVNVDISEDWIILNPVLQEQSYTLKEVKVYSGKENPADYIMRKAIAAAPYYRRQVLNYTAKVYVKGTGRLDESPRILKSFFKKQGIEIGRSYTTESINELEFRQPRTYREKVISLKSSMPFQGAPEPMRMARGSWYDVDQGEEISPLSPQAFGVYQFILEGSFYENGIEVNKIKVQPKRKGNDLYSGSLYIIEKLWCLHSCDLSHEQSGMKVTVKASYKNLLEYPFVWIPVTYDISAIGDYLGIKGSFRYLASLSNYKIQLNPNVSHQWVQQLTAPPALKDQELVQPETKPSKKTKKQAVLEELMAKEKPSKMEMLKMASILKSEAELASRQLMNENDSTELIIDSLAQQRDTVFWSQNRPVPLLIEEAQGFAIKDSSRKVLADTGKHNRKISILDMLYSRDSFAFRTRQNYFSFRGPLNKISLNSVEGFAIQTEWNIGNFKPNNWRISQMIKAPLERFAIQSSTSLSYRFSPENMGILTLKGGSIIRDYQNNGIDALTDAFQLLLLKQNYSKHFQQEFIQMEVEREIVNGLQMQVQISALNRFSLENISRYQAQEGIAGISNNIPYLNNAMQSNRSFQYALGLSYRPYQTYKMRRNRKIYLPNAWPKIQLHFREGMNRQMQFQKLDLELEQEVYLRHWVKLNYRFQAGTFPSSSRIYFPDFQHFAGNQSFVFEGSPLYRFQQLPYYAYSTMQSYQFLMMQLEFKYLLLKRLPVLNLTDLKEQLYFNYLHTEHPLYFETGYRLNEIFGRVSLGINFHFIQNQYRGAGFMVSIKLR